MFKRTFVTIILAVLLSPLSALADGAAEFKLSEENYRWMLGIDQPVFKAAFELARAHAGTPGLTAAGEPEIREIFRSQAPGRAILWVTKTSGSARLNGERNETNFEGWVIALDGNTYVGVKNTVYQNRETGNLEVLIGHCDAKLGEDCNPANWFSQSWYKIEDVLPFRAEFVAANLDERKFSLADLRVSGAHYLNLIMIDEFSRLEITRSLSWSKHNPDYESLSTIYADPNSRHMSLGRMNELTNAAKHNRSLVAMFDTGLDYNSPAIAYKLVRTPSPSQTRLGAIKIALDDANSKISMLSILRKVTPAKFTDSTMAALQNRSRVLGYIYSFESHRWSYSSHGWDFVENDNRPYDHTKMDAPNEMSRATRVADIAAGNGEATAILPIRITDTVEGAQNEPDADRFEAAVIYAEAFGARVVNVSFSHYLNSNALVATPYYKRGATRRTIDAVIKANEKDHDNFSRIAAVMKSHPKLLFVLAAGNEDVSSPNGLTDADQDFPVRQGNPSIQAPNVIVVAALDDTGSLSKYSVFGKSSVQVAAPGGLTDYAAAYVSHAAAYLFSRNTHLTSQEVSAVLRASVIKAPSLKEKTVWGGYLNFDSLREKYQ